MQYDSNCTSEAGYPMADVLISVSVDNGSTWSVGTNVTRTCPGRAIPAPGNMHERDQTLEETVSDGFLHLFYEIDHDAGSMVQYEGVPTFNQMIYQRVPVDSIAATPLVPNYPLHYDSTGFLAAPERRIDISVPRDVVLHPAYPNPFNSSSVIRFDLPMATEISLTIYDLLGREVETLQTGMIGAGAHQLTWDASARASGLYFVVLTAERFTRVHKLMLLR
jgi:hypothetical protein